MSDIMSRTSVKNVNKPLEAANLPVSGGFFAWRGIEKVIVTICVECEAILTDVRAVIQGQSIKFGGLADLSSAISPMMAFIRVKISF